MGDDNAMKQKMYLVLTSFVLVFSLVGCSNDKESNSYKEIEYNINAINIQARYESDVDELFLSEEELELLLVDLNELLDKATFYSQDFEDLNRDHLRREVQLTTEDGAELLVFTWKHGDDFVYEIVDSVLEGHLVYIESIDIDKINNLIDTYSKVYNPFNDYLEIELDYTFVEMSSIYNGGIELNLNNAEMLELLSQINNIWDDATFYTQTHLPGVCDGDIRVMTFTTDEGVLIKMFQTTTSDNAGCSQIAPIWIENELIGYMLYDDYLSVTEVLNQYSLQFDRYSQGN